jgi:aspartate/methionine/tyrosine aminotransferase
LEYFMSANIGLPSKRSDVAPFLAMDVLAEAARLEAEGRKIIHMEVGQPAAPAPKAALEASRLALEHGKIGYTAALGISGLRTRLSLHYKQTYGVDVPEERIMATTGSSAGFSLAFLAAFDPGDRIVLTAPGYPAYRNIIKALGLVPVELEVGPETRWSLTPDLIAKAQSDGPVKGVLVASPANPTGTMMTRDALQELVLLFDDEGIWFISDEIYHGLVYAGEQETALRNIRSGHHHQQLLEILLHDRLADRLDGVARTTCRPAERIAQSLYISPPELSQIAAVAALGRRQELEAVKDGYARNRNLLLKGLPEIGFDELLPVDGAFYIYAIQPFQQGQHSNLPRPCSTKQGSRPRRAWILTRFTARSTRDSPSPGRMATWNNGTCTGLSSCKLQR